jgi:hypothetical protein
MSGQAFSNVEIKILDQDLDKNQDFRVIETVKTLSRQFLTCQDQLLKPLKIFSTVETNFLQVSRLRLSIKTRSRQIVTPRLNYFKQTRKFENLLL